VRSPSISSPYRAITVLRPPRAGFFHMAIKEALDAANGLSQVDERLQALKAEQANTLQRAQELQALIDQQQALVNSAAATLKQCAADL